MRNRRRAAVAALAGVTVLVLNGVQRAGDFDISGELSEIISWSSLVLFLACVLLTIVFMTAAVAEERPQRGSQARRLGVAAGGAMSLAAALRVLEVAGMPGGWLSATRTLAALLLCFGIAKLVQMGRLADTSRERGPG